MQKYSIANQTDAIAIYAASRNIEIVRTYADSGRSGLRLAGRTALQELITEVRSGQAAFSLILVYDVSRWGRFQDIDESAYYEFICRKTGVNVEYCSESFANDGSLSAVLLKSIKRAMAGEYSRELSKKVWIGQSRITSLGYNSGAAPGYGLRRLLLNEAGQPKMVLETGQRKNTKAERVTFVRGPDHECAVVSDVYRLFIDDRYPLNAIAKILNQRGVTNVAGRLWTSMAIRDLLTNEKYVGNHVYNRGSKKLGGRWRRNAESQWVRAFGAFEGIVSLDRFAAARRQLINNRGRYTDNFLLDMLSSVWCVRGRLDRDLINNTSKSACTNAYRAHFGTLAEAYHMIGYRTAVASVRRTSLNLRRHLCAQIARGVTDRGGQAEMLGGRSCQLLINDTIVISVVLGRSPPAKQMNGENQWRFGYRSKLKPDLLLVARLDPGSSTPRDYFVLPFAFLPDGTWLTVSGVNYARLESFRCETLAPLFQLLLQEPIHG